MIKKKLLDQILNKILKKTFPLRILLFGSCARDDMTRGSDIDIVLFGVDKAEILDLKYKLNNEIDTLRDIDILAFEEINNKNLKKRILSEGIIIYEKSTK